MVKIGGQSCSADRNAIMEIRVTIHGLANKENLADIDCGVFAWLIGDACVFEISHLQTGIKSLRDRFINIFTSCFEGLDDA